jgi:ABC-type protease/lipase transport system fused ATPase/permease subunit
VARLAQVHDRILSLPEGYQTRIDSVGSIFSESERHRLAFARALFPDPKLLIVDEPHTTFRDALSRGLKAEMADYLARGGILIMLTRLALKRYHPTLRFVLDNGALKNVEAAPVPDLKIVGLGELRSTKNNGSVLA